MGPETKEEGGDEEAGSRTLIVRAQDGETTMGEDLVLPVTGDETVVEIQEPVGGASRRVCNTQSRITLMKVIKAIKGVPLTRMAVFKGGDASPISDKHMTWSLSRNGLYDGDILLIKPTRPNQWLWHPLEWYEERLLKAVEDIASSNPWAQRGRGCPLSVLEEKVLVPPPLARDSLKGILRRFPDRLRLELDLVSERFVVYPNQEAMLLPSSY